MIPLESQNNTACDISSPSLPKEIGIVYTVGIQEIERSLLAGVSYVEVARLHPGMTIDRIRRIDANLAASAFKRPCAMRISVPDFSDGGDLGQAP